MSPHHVGEVCEALKPVPFKNVIDAKLHHCDDSGTSNAVVFPCLALLYLCNLSSGKDALYNIVAFAKESVSAHVTTLRPENFPRDEKEPWLVDFFAPVSPSRESNM